MSGKWTPGMYHVSPKAAETPDSVAILTRGGHPVALATDISIAALFAASPDLYAALEDLRKRFHKALIYSGTTEPYATIACEKADAALAKARGEA